MMDRIKKMAGEFGLDHIWLTVNKHNDTTIMIYKAGIRDRGRDR